MNGHKISGTRQWNRHWQSGRGGFVPPIYQYFGNFPMNILYISLYDIRYAPACQFWGYTLKGLFCFIDENRIYFNYHDSSTEKYLIPAHLVIKLRDKISFSTDDLFTQYPTGFHNITMRQTTLTFFGEDVEFYEVEFDTNEPYDQRYIEYDFTGETINYMQIDAYTESGSTNPTRTYFDTWRFTGIPTRPSPYTKRSNLVFEDNLSNYYVGKIGEFGVAINGMFMPPYHIFSYDLSYDLNDLYANNGSFNFTLEGEIVFFAGNSLIIEATGSPAFNSVILDPVVGGNYTGDILYENSDVTWLDLFVRFNIDSSNSYSILDHIKMSTYY